MSSELGTMNLLLGMMAAVSVLEALTIVGMAIVGFVVYRRILTVLAEVESRHLAPAMTRVNAILDNVRVVTTNMREETERLDQAIHRTLDRMDETADRVRSKVRAKTSWLVGVARGLHVVVEGLSRSPPARNVARSSRQSRTDSGEPGISEPVEEATWHADTIVSTQKVETAVRAS
jgi:hypothetical protein